MISSEVERTLVKSPPELWAELSDPAALARHLGELGDIRITRTEPEQKVEWAAENTQGTVSLAPSGWGTTVKLTVVRDLCAPEAEASAAEAQPPETAEPELETAEPEPETAGNAEPDVPPAPEPSLQPELDLAAEAPTDVQAEQATEPRRGFFARLFGRRRRAEIAQPPQLAAPQPPAPPVAKGPQAEPHEPRESSDPFAVLRAALTPETFAGSRLFVAEQPNPQPTPDVQALTDSQPAPEHQPADHERNAADISAELREAEEAAEAEVTAVLTAVLDRLGAAHHRPFSRA